MFQINAPFGGGGAFNRGGRLIEVIRYASKLEISAFPSEILSKRKKRLLEIGEMGNQQNMYITHFFEQLL